MKYNSGSIIANDNTNIMGNNIHNNGGLISGNFTTIVANTDVVNTSGTIVGESNVKIHANQDVINEGVQYKPFATLSMLSSSYENRTNASLTLDDSFNKAIENLPKFRKFNKNNPEDLRDAGKNLDGYDDSKKEVYYEVKDDDGRIKRVYAGAPEKFKAFQENNLTSRNIENMINNAEMAGKKFSDNLLDDTLIAKHAPKTKEMISDAIEVLSSKGMDYSLKPVRFVTYINNIIYDDFDKYKANKMVVIKWIPDIYTYYRENMRRDEKNKVLFLVVLMQVWEIKVIILLVMCITILLSH